MILHYQRLQVNGSIETDVCDDVGIVKEFVVLTNSMLKYLLH